MTSTKARKKAKAPRDADYLAAWKACRKPWPAAWGFGQEVDLRVLLDKLLKSGWSIQALKAYAYCVWRHVYGRDRYDHVTAFAWRYAVDFANADIGGDASRHLTQFSANPERYAHVK